MAFCQRHYIDEHDGAVLRCLTGHESSEPSQIEVLEQKVGMQTVIDSTLVPRQSILQKYL
jgi:hypothetical protein